MAHNQQTFERCQRFNEPHIFPSSSRGQWRVDPRLASLTGLQSLFAQCFTLIPVDIREHQSSASHRTNITFDAFVQFLTSDTNTPPACSYYAKDIHLERLFPASDLFCFPSEFADDWLGDYFKYLHPEDDYTFLYVGGPQSSTGFHCDVLHSCSVSHNISGAKLWTLWPPHPALRKLQECDSNGYDNITLSKSLIEMPHSELIQQEGETIFVPSGWFHTVQNLSPLVISVNKNWFNAHSVYESWRFLLGELNAVRAELWHLTLPSSSSGQLTKEGLQVMEAREWLETCERLVKANAALGLKNFTELLVLQAVKMTGRTRGWNKLLLPDLSIEQYLDGKSRQWTEILAEDRVELEGKGDGAHFFFYTESAFSKNESSAPPPSAISFPLTELEKQKETTGLCSLSRTRFSALQITRIGREILSSDELFSHIATAYYASLKQRESILHPVRYEDYLFTFRAAFTEMLGDLYDAV